jgi:hypothetical protein
MSATCCCDPCESVLAGEEPDMRLGDTCLLCLCRECERCGESIDIDCENQIKDGQRGPAEFQGYWDVCDGCLLDSDILYDEELEAERRA